MKFILRSLAISMGLAVAAGTAVAGETVVNFDADAVNGAPKGMTCELGGWGRPGIWKVKENKDAGAGNKMLGQLGKSSGGGRFPVCVIDGLKAKDGELSVRFKPISGRVDQAAGIVWRYQDKGNFYVVRANALEDNVVTYKMQRGRRSDLPLMGKGYTYGAKAPVPRNEWGTLSVSIKGDIFTISLNGKELYKVKDKTFTKAGRFGIWTKADSVTYFDDLKVVTQ